MALAVAQRGALGTSSEGEAGPNGADTSPHRPSVYSTTTTA